MTTRSDARRRRGSHRQVKPEPRPTYKRDEPVLRFWRSEVRNPTFVYFIQQGEDGPVKIGTAKDPRVRLSELGCGNPEPLYIRAIVLGDRTTEQQYHHDWAQARLTGEWFGHGAQEIIITLAQQASHEQMEMFVAGATECAVMVHATSLRLSAIRQDAA